MIKSLNKIIIAVVICSFVFSVVSGISQTLDDEVNDIAGELLCPVCQGQSVAESNSALAQDMRATIRNKLSEGQSKEQILEYFKASYGNTILGSPPLKGINYFLWLLPILSLTIGALFIFYILRNYKKPLENNINSASTDNKYLERIEDELNNSE